MYFWNSYPFIRFSLALILGIVLYDQQPNLWSFDQMIMAIGIISLGISISYSRKLGFYKLRHVNGCLAIFLIVWLGASLTKLHYHSHPPNHYSNQDIKPIGFSGIITSPPNERTNHVRFDFELESILTSDSTIHTSGKIHLYVKKDSINHEYQYGDRLAIYGSYYPVPGPDNPNEFDYQTYLKRQNIISHAFVKSHNVKVLSSNPPNKVLFWAFKLRKYATDVIDRNMQAPREKGIAKALLVGIKDYLDNDIKKAYSSAGAMHVLAVSGLHVGIIFLLIQLLFGKLKNLGRSGGYLFASISVLAIWAYACMTGLSPSVLRAATMFSFISVGQISAREGNIYNTLGFAAFILLLFDPYLIYSVGFQLSFAAVIGIVYLQPKLYRLWIPQFWLLDKAWAITCVSIAAQLATFPLSAYYFHQFPTYFLASNLIVIPASFVMLLTGVFMIMIDSMIPYVAKLIGYCLEWMIWCLNTMISYVDNLPNSLIEWIYIDQFGLISIYLIVITVIIGIHYQSFKTIVISSVLCMIFVLSVTISNYQQSKRKELIFYEIADKVAVDYINGHQASLFIDLNEKEDLELLSFQIDPHRLASHLRPIEESLLNTKSVFHREDAFRSGMIANKRIIIFDSTTFHLDFHKKIDADLIVIENESVKSLKWLEKHLYCEKVIIGNRNSNYYSRKMKRQASDLGVNIHSLKEDGSLRIYL